MKLFGKIYNKNKVLYYGLIATFAVLYIATAFVSWYHAITFFNIANAIWLSIILSFVAEIGQAGILFAILLSKNKQKFLSWITMVLLTSLQVIGNVVASYKFIVISNSTDFTFFQKSILFWVQTDNPEMFKIIIAWIAGALLPIIALSMTALVAQNINMLEKEIDSSSKSKVGSIPDEEVDEIIENEVEKRVDAIKPLVKKYDDLQKTIEEYKEQTPSDEVTEIIDDFGVADSEVAAFLDEESERLTPDVKTEITSEINEPPKRKRGRPPKQKGMVAEPKKEQELLLKEEDVKVPQRKRFVDPLKKKDKKIKPIKDLKEIIKPSRGEEVIELIENLEKNKDKDTITLPVISDEITPDVSLIPSETLSPYLDNSGVEVIDAKAVPKEEEPEVKKNVIN